MRRVRHRPPLQFKIIQWLLKNEIRGGNLVRRIMPRLGLDQTLCWFKLGEEGRIVIPLYWPYLYSVQFSYSADNYEKDVIAHFSKTIASLPVAPTFIDCGADIGIFSSLLSANRTLLDSYTLLEPNRESFKIAQYNVESLGIPATLHNVAVSDFRGRAKLVTPVGQKGRQGCYIERREDGDIEVLRIDDFDINTSIPIALKIDVEGAELSVMKGASRVLSNVPEFVVHFEAHPSVAKRSGTDPVDCLKYLSSLRNCHWVVVEAPYTQISTDKPFFSQVDDGFVYNVIVATHRKFDRSYKV